MVLCVAIFRLSVVCVCLCIHILNIVFLYTLVNNIKYELY